MKTFFLHLRSRQPSKTLIINSSYAKYNMNSEYIMVNEIIMSYKCEIMIVCKQVNIVGNKLLLLMYF